MRHFRPLELVAVTNETDDCKRFVFAVPDAYADEFDFIQGQHLTLKTEVDGVELRRNYSLCTPAGSGELAIAIRHIDGGRFSTWAHEHLAPGVRIDAMGPSGGLHTPLDPSQSNTYVAFAAGIGITPILSLIATTLRDEPESEFVLFYGNRDRRSIVFHEALQDLKNRYVHRFSLHVFLTREPLDNEIYNGRLDAQRVAELCATLCPPNTVDEFFVCGPSTMNDDVTAALVAAGADAAHVHAERWLSGESRPVAASPIPEDAAGESAADDVQVTVILDGASREFAMARDAGTVLEAAMDAGIDLPYSCMAGVCSTCRSKRREGEVEMEQNYALEDWEVDEGFVLTCQSRPLSDRLVLDFDET